MRNGTTFASLPGERQIMAVAGKENGREGQRRLALLALARIIGRRVSRAVLGAFGVRRQGAKNAKRGITPTDSEESRSGAGLSHHQKEDNRIQYP